MRLQGRWVRGWRLGPGRRGSIDLPETRLKSSITWQPEPALALSIERTPEPGHRRGSMDLPSFPCASQTGSSKTR
jgi:hypothetical protein